MPLVHWMIQVLEKLVIYTLKFLEIPRRAQCPTWPLYRYASEPDWINLIQFYARGFMIQPYNDGPIAGWLAMPLRFGCLFFITFQIHYVLFQVLILNCAFIASFLTQTSCLYCVCALDITILNICFPC